MQGRRLAIFDTARPRAEDKSALARSRKLFAMAILALLAVGAVVRLNYFGGVRIASAFAVLTSLVQSEMPTRLIIGSPRGAIDEPLPVGIAIENATGGETVTITGLADGTELSLGSLSDSRAWTVGAGDVEQTFVGPPRHFVGRMEATASLRSASGRLLDQQALQLEWPPGTTSRAQRRTATLLPPPLTRIRRERLSPRR
jgi:hypothetical protein